MSRIVKGSLVITNLQGVSGGFLKFAKVSLEALCSMHCIIVKDNYVNVHWFKSNDAKWKLLIFSPVANFLHQSQCCHSQAILDCPINHLATLATKTYTKSIRNTVSGCHNCLIFSYVGCKN